MATKKMSSELPLTIKFEKCKHILKELIIIKLKKSDMILSSADVENWH